MDYTKLLSGFKMSGSAMIGALGVLKNIPKMKQMALKKIEERGLDKNTALNDDTFLTEVFTEMHNDFPKSIRKALTKDAFIKMCLREKNKFLAEGDFK